MGGWREDGRRGGKQITRLAKAGGRRVIWSSGILSVIYTTHNNTYSLLLLSRGEKWERKTDKHFFSDSVPEEMNNFL